VVEAAFVGLGVSVRVGLVVGKWVIAAAV